MWGGSGRAERPRGDCGGDRRQRAIHVLQNQGGWYSKGAHALAPQPGVATSVALGPVGDAMAVSVDLDGQSSLGTIEVEDASIDRVLPAKAEAVKLASSQLNPEQHLWQFHTMAQFARSSNGRRTVDHL